MSVNNKNPYEDMLDMEHPTSRRHPRMEKEKRAAQFAPFAALTGYGDVIEETARYTESEMILDENQKSRLDQVLQDLMKEEHPAICVTYFVPDLKKSGGRYVTKTAVLQAVSEQKQMLLLEDGEKIPFGQIADLSEA